MFFGPPLEFFEHGDQRLPQIRQRVLDPRWHLGMNFSSHQPVIFQLAQLMSQHALRDAFQGTQRHGGDAR